MTRHRSSPVGARRRMLVLPCFELLVRVLDHHDRRVDHRADRDRDAAERHDVGVDALACASRRTPPARRAAARRPRRAPSAGAAGTRGTRARRRRTPRRACPSGGRPRARSAPSGRRRERSRRRPASPGFSCSSFALTASIVSSAFLPERSTTMPPTTSPSPSSSAMPRRISGPSWTRADIAAGTPVCRPRRPAAESCGNRRAICR